MGALIAKSVIIVASGRANYAAGGALDELINAIVAMDKNPILVLGPDGDDLMRTCSAIESCEIVFDPNFQGEIFSSIKAGLEAVSNPAFVIPLAEKNLLDIAAWPQLEAVLRTSETRSHVIRPVTQNGAAALYPQIVTAHGLLPLKALPATTDWVSSDRIRTETVVVSAPSA